MNEFLARLWVSITTLFTPAPAVSRVMVHRSNRALTFIEYALLAGIVIAVAAGIALIFGPALEVAWNNIMSRLGNATAG